MTMIWDDSPGIRCIALRTRGEWFIWRYALGQERAAQSEIGRAASRAEISWLDAAVLVKGIREHSPALG